MESWLENWITFFTVYFTWLKIVGPLPYQIKKKKRSPCWPKATQRSIWLLWLLVLLLPTDCTLKIRVLTITTNDAVKVAYNTTTITFPNCITKNSEHNCSKVTNCDVSGIVRVWLGTYFDSLFVSDQPNDQSETELLHQSVRCLPFFRNFSNYLSSIHTLVTKMQACFLPICTE